MATNREFFEAAQTGDLERLDSALREGASPNAANEHGQTALALSAMFGHSGVVSRLLEAGADPNAADSAGITILMTAAEFPYPETVRLLLASGAEVNAVAKDGRTALLNAVWSAASIDEVAEALVDAGADVTIKDRDQGLTPRKWAEKGGKHSVARLLAGG